MSRESGRVALTLTDAGGIIARAAWTSAKTTQDIAPHEYVVNGWDRDDLPDQEFWQLVELIKATGREEVWTPPAEWVRRWGGRPMTNRYLYLGEHAYWFTWPRNGAAMLNREHVSVQQKTPTRRPLDAFDPAAFAEDHEWTFAKTMADIPHEYVVRGKNGCDAADWDRMVAHIKEHGCWARWTAPSGRATRLNLYLELGEFKYWVIYPVINRERLARSTTVPLPPAEAKDATERLGSVAPERWGWAEEGF